jgi:4'-phosphopantetheinyl transferase
MGPGARTSAEESVRVDPAVAGPAAGVLVAAGATAAVLAAARAAGRPPERLLSAAERERAAALRRPADRDDYLAAHALVRACGSRHAGRDADELTVVQTCDTCGGPHGRPRFAEAPEVWASIAHTRGYVVAAADGHRVGVDVERLRGGEVGDGLGRLTLAPAETAAVRASADQMAAYLGLWVIKEALVKVGELSMGRFAATDLACTLHGPGGGQVGAWEGLLLARWRLAGDGVLVGCASERPATLVQAASLFS